jgi:hypothetical protein
MFHGEHCDDHLMQKRKKRLTLVPTRIVGNALEDLLKNAPNDRSAA